MKLTELAAKEVFLTEEDLFEMTNLKEKTTGVAASIWVGPTDGKHSNRVKVSNHPTDHRNDCFVLQVSSDPQIVDGQCKLSAKTLKDIKRWIIKNEVALNQIDTILQNGGDTTDIIARLVKL